MIWNTKILKAEFLEKTFLEKKTALLDLLSTLPSDNQKVLDLVVVVNSITSESDSQWLFEVFDIILDALISVEDKWVQQIEKILERAKVILLEIKKMEETERAQTKLLVLVYYRILPLSLSVLKKK